MKKLNWLEFKTICARYALEMQSFETNDYYYIYAAKPSGEIIHECEILKHQASDIQDFEANYKPNANNVQE